METTEEITSAGLAKESYEEMREAYKVDIDDRAEPKLKESLNEGAENGAPHNASQDSTVQAHPTTATLACFTKA